MARSLFGSGNGEGPSFDSVAAAAAPESLTAFIDQGSEFEGKLSFKDTVRIDGQFKGEISSQNTLIVGEPGVVVASIRSQTVVVSGEVIGDIVAAQRLVLHKTARVEGDVTTPSIAIEEGAVLQGRVTMLADNEARKAHLKAVEGGAEEAQPAAPNPS